MTVSDRAVAGASCERLLANLGFELTPHTLKWFQKLGHWSNILESKLDTYPKIGN